MQNNKKEYLKPVGIALLALVAIVTIASFTLGDKETQTAKPAAAKQSSNVAKSDKNSGKSTKNSDTAQMKRFEPVTEIRKATVSTRSGPPTKRLSSR